MKKNLKNKIALIIGVLVLCLYGIFGIPSGISGSALLKAISNRIHLGLDLQGGAHLILQVQVSDAINDETDNTMQDIEQTMKKGEPELFSGLQARSKEARCNPHRGHRARTIRCRQLACCRATSIRTNTTFPAVPTITGR